MQKTIYIFLAFSIILISACESIEIDNTDKEYPIELELIEDANHSVTLQWTKTEISSFESYIIVRSSTQKVESLMEPFNDGINKIVAVIEDFDKNTFKDLPTLVSDSLFYKVFVDIGNRYLSSSIVYSMPKATSLPVNFDNAAYSPNTNKLFFYSITSPENLLVASTIDNSDDYEYLPIPSNSTSSYELFVENNGNEDYLFLHDYSSHKFYKYSTLSYAPLVQYPTNKDIFSIAMSTNNLTFASIRDAAGSAYVYKGNDAQPVTKHNKNVYSQQRSVKFVPNSTNEFIEASRSLIIHYKLYSNGDLFDYERLVLGNTTAMTEMAISPDGKYFLTYNDGVIYHQNLSVYDTLDIGLNFFPAHQQYGFSKDGKYLYSLAIDQLFKFSFPNLELEDVLEFDYIPEQFFINNDNDLVVVGKFNDPSILITKGVYQTIRF